MVVTFAVILFGILAFSRPLQKNPFYVLHSGLVVLAAYFVEGRYFTVNPLSPKILLLLLVFHIVFINITAFIAMRVDKRAAIKGKMRIPERNLHQLELMGGVPGSWLGQKVFNHKRAKKDYQTTFVGIFIFQVVIVIAVLKYLGIL